MTTVKISPLKKIDKDQIERINQLIIELFGSFDHLLSKTYIESVIKNHNSKFLTAYKNKLLVGMVLVHIYTSLSRRVAILDELVIDRRFKGQKIAHQLIKAAKTWAQNNNADCLECTTRLGNSEALRFFQKEGFYDRKQKALRLKLK